MLTIVIVFVGLLFILNSIAGWIYGYTIKSFPSPFPSNAWYRRAATCRRTKSA